MGGCVCVLVHELVVISNVLLTLLLSVRGPSFDV